MSAILCAFSQFLWYRCCVCYVKFYRDPFSHVANGVIKLSYSPECFSFLYLLFISVVRELTAESCFRKKCYAALCIVALQTICQ